MVNLGPLFGELKTCLRKDQFILKKRLHGIKKINDETKQANIAQKIAEDIARSQQLRVQRLAAIPTVTYPEQLPVSQKKEDIKNTLASGTCTTYDEYRYLVGIYKGLSESEIILTDLEKKYLSGEDFEDAKR